MRSAESEAASIVMVGSFNPAIFQPRWLGSQELIRPEEAAKAKITIIQSELADFSTEWFQLVVLQNRLQLITTDPRQYAPLRDLAAALFTILPHTPVKALGINRHFHFKMPSEKAWHAIGHLLAPKDHWNTIMEAPGLRTMTMEGRRKDTKAGRLHIKVEPSAKVEHGLFVDINEELKPSLEHESDGAQWVPASLAEHWEAVMSFAEIAAEQIIGLAIAKEA